LLHTAPVILLSPVSARAFVLMHICMYALCFESSVTDIP
jgi:hypothetical protein